jgi:hypothetical protein
MAARIELMKTEELSIALEEKVAPVASVSASH